MGPGHVTVPCIDLPNNILYCNTPDLSQSAYIIMMVSDILTPNKCQSIPSNHNGFSKTHISHSTWYEYCMMAIQQAMFERAGEANSPIPDSKVHGANMGPTWVLSAPDGPHVGPTNFAIRDDFFAISRSGPCSHSNNILCIHWWFTPWGSLYLILSLRTSKLHYCERYVWTGSYIYSSFLMNV